MFKGLLSGVLVGGAVSLGAAAGLSLLIGGPTTHAPKPDAAAMEVPAGSEFNQSREDGEASLPASEPVVTGAVAPKVTAPEPDDISPMQDADRDPGVQPAAGALPGTLREPTESDGSAPTVNVGSDGPVALGEALGGQMDAPQAPQDGGELSISTEPSQPMTPPDAAEETALVEPEEGVEGEEVSKPDVMAESEAVTVAEVEPEEVAEATPEAEPEAAEPESAPEAAPQVQSDAPSMPAVPDIESAEVHLEPSVERQKDAAQAIEKTTVPDKPEDTDDELVIRVAPAPTTRVEAVPEPVDPPNAQDGQTAETDADQSPEAEVAETSPRVEILPLPNTANEPEVTDNAIRIGKPARDIRTLGTGTVKTGRLPSVRAANNAGETKQAGSVDRSAMPPIKRYAVAFQAPEDKPKMAIVLIDDGSSPAAMDTISAFPYPLTFAVDTSRDDAGDKMAIYRAAGFEVLAMVALPEGSAPTDVEVAMPVLLNRAPEAVAVMEAPEDGIQSDRQISDQVARILSDTGHGLLLYPKGLNTAQKLAAKNGVPSATIFRDFDSSGQNSRAIRRFLDNGALRAGSEGGVVMVGRMRPETVNALLLWGLEDRANQIALVPVSQLLLPQ